MKKLFILFIVIASIAKQSQAQIITTVAGTGVIGYSGDGGQATNAELYEPTGAVFDTSGNMYIADNDNNVIRKVSTSGIITTIAGNGTEGYSGDGGQATAAELKSLNGIVVDVLGSIYITDYYDNVIRKINTTGIISTIAGNGINGYSGDGGQATAAELNNPDGIATDTDGNIYITDSNNSRIRKINSAGIITTIAGDGVGGYTGDGGQATAAELATSTYLAVDIVGNLYITEEFHDRIRMVNTAGIITTVVGTGTAGSIGDGGQATAAELYFPSGLAVDIAGNLYIADTWNNRIRKVDTNGIITTIAGNGTQGYSGDGGAPINAELFQPNGVCLDNSGNLYIADQGNNVIRKVNCLPIISVNSGTICAGQSFTINPSGATTYSLSSGTSIVTPSVTSNYTVTGTSSLGCTALAVCSVTVTNCLGIETFNPQNQSFQIYPNPTNGSFVIEPQNTLYNVHCTVYDVNGKVVLSQTINGKTSIDAGSLNDGVYNISLQSNEGVVNKRLVIVR
jgi:sugar lactone lactonase YvrE